MAANKINVIGMGYVGSVIAAELADRGHQITAIDIDEETVESISRGDPAFQDLEGIMARNVEKGRIEASTRYEDATAARSIICVDTPESGDGSIDTSNIEDACRHLGQVMEEGHNIMIKSTVIPGTCEELLVPILEEASGMERGSGFQFCYSPEFLRGGDGLQDFRKPPKVVMAGDREAIEDFKSVIPLPESDNLFETDLEEAETVKYFDNVFHALKVSFANEVSRVAEEHDADAGRIMDILKHDKRLNISETYLDPGYPFGGPCLEKDIKALSREINGTADIPLIKSILETNRRHLDWILKKVESSRGVETVGILGLSYKAGINSDSYSQSVELAEKLGEKDYSVLGYDPYIEHPSVENRDFDSVVRDSDMLVVFNKEDEFRDIQCIPDDTEVIDLHDFLRSETPPR